MVHKGIDAVDGRLDRAMRSRMALCEAGLDLVEEGVLRPSADQIAERAGLSRRSVFHHFSDLAELYDAAAEVGMQRCAPLLKEIPREGSVAERIAMLTKVRSKFLEATSPYARALTARVLVGPAREQAKQAVREALRLQRREVEVLFRSELEKLSDQERTETLEALSAATSPSMWEYLRRSRRLSMSVTCAVMARNLAALLRDVGVDVAREDRS